MVTPTDARIAVAVAAKKRAEAKAAGKNADAATGKVESRRELVTAAAVAAAVVATLGVVVMMQ